MWQEGYEHSSAVRGDLTLEKNRAKLIFMRVPILLASLVFLSTCTAQAKKCLPPVRIVVIDSGFGYRDAGHEANLCKFGHRDFTGERQFTKNYVTKDPIPLDLHGHGTNIVGIIDGYAKRAGINYCIVVLKYYSERQSGQENLIGSIRAINYAANIKADFINYSGGGPEQDRVEHAAVKRFIKHGGTFVAAAGNEGQDLNSPESAYFPAMYRDGIIIVGNLCKDGVKCSSSNYGKAVTRWEIGEDVEAFGLTMTGTSQATAVATGKLVAQSTNKCDIGF